MKTAILTQRNRPPAIWAAVWGLAFMVAPGLCAAEFTFKLPGRTQFKLDLPATRAVQAVGPSWLAAHPTAGNTNRVELGRRLVLQVENAEHLAALLSARPVSVARQVTTNCFILEAPDPLTAAEQAASLSERPGVTACHPVMRRTVELNGPYAPRSNDPLAVPYYYTGGGQYVEAQWPLENRDTNGASLGYDLNVFAAWPDTRGDGVVVAVADSGLDFIHPELTNRLAGAPHFNFDTLDANAAPFDGEVCGTPSRPFGIRAFWTHGTSVAGLIAAEADNARGMAGVAPQATLASWVVFTTNLMTVDDERLMDMYQYAADTVGVQNHSWGTGLGKAQGGPTLLEQIGINNATTLGRNGLGTVMVRAAGNDRGQFARADDDGYVNDPNVIAVAAASRAGRAADYSEPGACLLVAAPGGLGGGNYQGLLTLDLADFGIGPGEERGVNPSGCGLHLFGDYGDYRTGWSLGFSGTSAAAPLISGVAALLLSANPNLSYRDVQHILALSARHVDYADPDLTTNGAGFRVSHNVGFGIPDAGHAVWLARLWSNRPPLTTFSLLTTTPIEIPDGGLRIVVTGAGVPPELGSLACLPAAAGRYADAPTPALPLVDIGEATNVPAVNLTNQGALILRSPASFSSVLANAAAAGATFAVIYNSTNDAGYDLGLLSGTDYTPIPAVLVGNARGEALRALFQTNSAARARLQVDGATLHFDVESTLLCEQVGVRLRLEHPVRGDLRVTLISPQGTRSVFAQLNDDTNAAAADWTFWTTHDFFESSAGRWTLCVSDQYQQGAAGVVRSTSLILRGTQIVDADRDGLDDVWEFTHFGYRGLGPKDDPDSDGFSNAREQVMGTNPLAADRPFALDFCFWTLWDAKLGRLSWPSAPGYTYEVLCTTNLSQPMTSVTNLPGEIWETAYYGPVTDSAQRFYRVIQHPAP